MQDLFCFTKAKGVFVVYAPSLLCANRITIKKGLTMQTAHSHLTHIWILVLLIALAALPLASCKETEHPMLTETLPSRQTDSPPRPETVTESQPEPQPHDSELLLDFSRPLQATGTKISSFDCPEQDYITAQGCCFDGEYWTVAFNKFDERGEECTLLCQFDDSGELVNTSDGPLYLEHANNISFLPDESAYLVTSCQGTIRECWNGYSLVDRDTLTVIEKGTLAAPFFAMAYCPEREAFASGRWGGETLDFWDAYFNLTLTRNVPAPGTLSQGVFATEDSIWFVRSSRTVNQVFYHQEFRIYDWSGELLAVIPLTLERDAESESVNIVNGSVFVTSNEGNRAFLYQVDFSDAQP